MSRIRGRYNIDKGRMTCRCLIRKWKFYDHIEALADLKVSKDLVDTKSLKD